MPPENREMVGKKMRLDNQTSLLEIYQISTRGRGTQFCGIEPNLLGSDLRRTRRPQEGGREQSSLQSQASAAGAV